MLQALTIPYLSLPVKLNTHAIKIKKKEEKEEVV